ncbi:hypothetical protein SAMN05444365_10474 [Micromonospora pattaloongensis]|uniref:Uncharacterized protein n=1 Tax=Micromonospora pattaloongensis TaxID=405436 RepID=A0A1H3NPG3_9ACTN|nr:DUF6069 family protein [Micromonospora pattaloongensis]SDY90305.1 hypothetical protein SAMN05444365_10474 [Micromonospora pattaloongensis]
MSEKQQEPISPEQNLSQEQSLHREQPPSTPRRGVRVRNRAIVVLAGVVAATLVWVIAVPVLGADVSVPKQYGSDEKTDLTVGAVIFAALFAGLAGWALLAVLETFAKRRAALIWTIIAVVVFLVTLPWQMPGFSGANITVLALLHTTVAAVLIAGLPRAATVGQPH